MGMHPEVGQFVEKNTLVPIGDDVHLEVVGEQGEQGPQSALNTTDLEIVGDAKEDWLHHIEIRALSGVSFRSSRLATILNE
jgi:hypothetical protein